jgi:LysR substrate binding domain
MVCVLDRDNPRLSGGALTMDDLRALPHATVLFGVGNPTPANRALEELQVEPVVAVQLSGWLSLPFVVAGTDMLAIAPEWLARIVASTGGRLMIAEPPNCEQTLRVWPGWQ